MESEKKLNILILSWRGPGHPNAGGAEISTHEHAKRWVEKGHSVTLFTSFFKGAKENEVIDGVEIKREGNQFFGVHIKAFLWLMFQSPKYDLVIDQFHGIPFFTPLYIRVKKIAFIHEVAKEVWAHNEFSFPFNILTSVVGKICEPLIFKLYKKIHFMVVSQSTKNDLLELGIPSSNISIIHNGITKYNVNYKKENVFTLIYLGALTKDKGIETAFSAISIVQKNVFTKINFWIVGKGEEAYVKLLEYRAKELDLKDIKFWGFVNNSKKIELLARSHLLINTSIKEGWGLVVIEAASLGVPTVAFDVPGLRDSVVDGKTGLLSKTYTPEGLAEKIIYLIKDEGEIKNLGKNALLWSKNFSWEKAANLSFELIQKIAG